MKGKMISQKLENAKPPHRNKKWEARVPKPRAPVMEILARMWIECDPNRGGGEPGSGFHPDDPIGPTYECGSGMEPKRLPDTELTGKPYWHWFIPRAEASIKYLEDRGIRLATKD